MALACLPAAAGLAQHQPGRSYFGRSNYVEYVAGDLPLIVSVPHGGKLSPAQIPDRMPTGARDFTTATDTNTKELALAIQTAFHDRYGRWPHLIICHLKRTKVDCNRELSAAAGRNADAEQAWREFQDYINTASNAVVSSAGKGFYIDLHGHGHRVKRVELGYLLRGAQLTNSDAVLNQSGYDARSSLRRMAPVAGIPFAALLRGSNSIGGLLEARGFPSVPSPRMPSPGNGTLPVSYPGDKNPYFAGGYNLWVHTGPTSTNSVGLAGLQIEANFGDVRDSAANRARFADTLAEVLEVFLSKCYGLELTNGTGNSLKIGESEE
jgi:hypothetical protein